MVSTEGRHAYALDVFLEKFCEHVCLRASLKLIHFCSRKHGTLAHKILTNISEGHKHQSKPSSSSRSLRINLDRAE